MPWLEDFTAVLSLEVQAFTRHGPSGPWQRWRTTVTAALALVCYTRRALPDRSAVCLLEQKPGRAVVVAGAAGAAAAVLGAIAPGLALALAAVTIVTLAPAAFGALTQGGTRRRLAKHSPPGDYLLVHWLASTGGGGGALLLRALAEDAAVEGRSLLLSAATAPLVAYYQRLGFIVVSEVHTRRGKKAALMALRPASATAGNVRPVVDQSADLVGTVRRQGNGADVP